MCSVSCHLLNHRRPLHPPISSWTHSSQSLWAAGPSWSAKFAFWRHWFQLESKIGTLHALSCTFNPFRTSTWFQDILRTCHAHPFVAVVGTGTHLRTVQYFMHFLCCESQHWWMEKSLCQMSELSKAKQVENAYCNSSVISVHPWYKNINIIKDVLCTTILH